MNWQTEELKKRINAAVPVLDIEVTDSGDCTLINWKYNKNNKYDIYYAQCTVSEFTKMYGGEMTAKTDADLTKIRWF